MKVEWRSEEWSLQHACHPAPGWLDGPPGSPAAAPDAAQLGGQSVALAPELSARPCPPVPLLCPLPMRSPQCRAGQDGGDQLSGGDLAEARVRTGRPLPAGAGDHRVCGLLGGRASAGVRPWTPSARAPGSGGGPEPVGGTGAVEPSPWSSAACGQGQAVLTAQRGGRGSMEGGAGALGPGRRPRHVWACEFGGARPPGAPTHPRFCLRRCLNPGSCRPARGHRRPRRVLRGLGGAAPGGPGTVPAGAPQASCPRLLCPARVPGNGPRCGVRLMLSLGLGAWVWEPGVSWGDALGESAV